MAILSRYAVLGHPVGHSKSPFIHSQFARQTGQTLSYTAEDVEPEEFGAFLKHFFDNGGAGVNVTVPFKETAWKLVDQRSPRAELAGAVNTVYRTEEGRLAGDTTDGVGLVRDLSANHGAVLSGGSLLLVGAGGAVRGLLPDLLAENPARVTIVNRTASRAEQLARHFTGESAAILTGCGFDTLARHYNRHYKEQKEPAFDFIINGSAASLHGEVPPLPEPALDSRTWCYDMMYGSGDTPFQHWARARGAALVLDGIGMLVEQAAESFYLWRGVRPETGPVIQALSKELSKTPSDQSST